MKIFIVLLSLFTLSGIALASDIVLGQSAAFTGSSGELGRELWWGSNAYFSHINSMGGINGTKIKVLAVDDSYEGKKTLSNTIDLVLNKKVFALYGYVGTPTIVEALPAIQKFSREGIFLFSNFTGARAQREKPFSDHVFNVRASYKEETAGLVEHLYEKGKRRFALFLQFDAYGRAGATGVQKALANYNLNVVADTTYERGAKFEQSMMSQVNAIIKSKADVVISVGSYAASAAFIRDARNAGFKGVIANLSFVGPDALLALLLAEERKKNKSYTHQLLNTQVVPPPSDMSYELVREFHEVMGKDARNHPLTFTSLEGFLNAKVFVEILKQAQKKGEVTRESFYKAAKKIHQLDEGLGKARISFNNPASQGLNVIYYTTIENKRYVSVNDWDHFR